MLEVIPILTKKTRQDYFPHNSTNKTYFSYSLPEYSEQLIYAVIFENKVYLGTVCTHSF